MITRKSKRGLSVQRQRLLSLHKAGYGCTAIAKELGVSKATVQLWVGRYRRYGIKGLEELKRRPMTTSFRCKVVRSVVENNLSLWETAFKFNINRSTVSSWVSKYKEGGYEALNQQPQGKTSMTMGRPRRKKPETELEKLQYENELLKTENALLKKLKALIEEREALQQRIGYKSSRD